MVKNHYSKIFIANTVLFIGILFIILYMFHLIDKKSEQMLYHKTTITKEIYNIKYKVTESHLWFMEYLAGDKKEKKNQ